MAKFRRWLSLQPMQKLVVLLGVILGLASAAAGQGQTLRYEAYIAGIRAGGATVQLDISADDYVIVGTASADGLLDIFANWRVEFNAQGKIVDARAELTEFHYVERDDLNQREVTVRDGVLHVVENGKQLSTRSALPGTDLLTALFVAPQCSTAKLLHAGRQSFRLRRLESVNEAMAICKYDVLDDAGEHFQVTAEFSMVGGLTIPVKLSYEGLLSGWLELVQPEVGN